MENKPAGKSPGIVSSNKPFIFMGMIILFVFVSTITFLFIYNFYPRLRAAIVVGNLLTFDCGVTEGLCEYNIYTEKIEKVYAWGYGSENNIPITWAAKNNNGKWNQISGGTRNILYVGK